MGAVDVPVAGDGSAGAMQATPGGPRGTREQEHSAVGSGHHAHPSTLHLDEQGGHQGDAVPPPRDVGLRNRGGIHRPEGHEKLVDD